MLSLKALPPMTNFLSLLTLLVISTTALAGNPPFPFNDEALRFDLMSHEKAMHGRLSTISSLRQGKETDSGATEVAIGIW